MEFENCPDREAICTNAAIIFYFNGCYVNALNFFREVVQNRDAIANNLGLTLLHLLEYQKGINCLLFATEQNPENIIFAANL